MGQKACAATSTGQMSSTLSESVALMLCDADATEVDGCHLAR